MFLLRCQMEIILIFAGTTKLNYDWSIITKRLNTIYKDVKNINKEYSTEVSKKLYMDTFNNTKKIILNGSLQLESTINEQININCSFFKEPTVEINGNSKKTF